MILPENLVELIRNTNSPEFSKDDARKLIEELGGIIGPSSHCGLPINDRLSWTAWKMGIPYIEIQRIIRFFAPNKVEDWFLKGLEKRPFPEQRMASSKTKRVLAGYSLDARQRIYKWAGTNAERYGQHWFSLLNLGGTNAPLSLEDLRKVLKLSAEDVK